ncbi:MAG: RAD52 family DNA repair protein [Chloroflexota bacterium]|nr:RAD52 family DNA repair protein [Chloroflexota bacterium]MDE2884833.1 RAD52 family DNA repair protein [Chloroflexota bacterium]
MENGTTDDGPNNGVHRDEVPVSPHDLLWESLPPKVVQELERPLDPNLISFRKGRKGGTYPYIEGHTAIDEANRIFGYGGWGYELVGEVTQWVTERVDSDTGQVNRSCSYAAAVRVTVPGAQPRADVGFHTVADESAEGHETAYKAAVTDGLKRALRSFGGRFGNSLYGDGVADVLAPSLRRTLVDLGAALNYDETQVRAAVRARTGSDVNDLPVGDLVKLVEGAARKVQEAAEAHAAPQQDGPAELPAAA